MHSLEHTTVAERYAFWLGYYTALQIVRNGRDSRAVNEALSTAALAIVNEQRPALLPYGRA